MGCALCAASCSKQLNLVEQLDPPNKQVPIISAPMQQPDWGKIYCLNGQYYLPLTVVYATRRTLWTDTAPYIYTPLAGTEQRYLFPLTDREAEDYLGRERGTVKQPVTAPKPAPIAAANFPFAKATKVPNRVKATFPTALVPQSARCDERTYNRVGATSILPIKNGQRSLAANMALVPVFLVETVGNTVICAVHVPFYLIAGIFYYFPFPYFPFPGV